MDSFNNDLTEDQRLMKQSCRDFIDRVVSPFLRHDWQREWNMNPDERLPKEILKAADEISIRTLAVPEKYGGTGLDMVAYATAVMELARADASVAITMAAHTSLGTLPILLHGSEKQKITYLPKLASGELIGAFGLTEPEAGSDASSTKTMAVKKGDEYIVNGGKIFITNAGKAGLISFTSQI